MRLKLHFDDIIFQLQRRGGASAYWTNVTKRIVQSEGFQVSRSAGSRIGRLLPYSTSADIGHSSHFRIPLSRQTRCVVTIYDFMYERGMVNTAGRFLNVYERRKAIQRADAIICISNSTMQDLAEFYPNVVGNRLVVVSPLASSFEALPLDNILPSDRLSEYYRKAAGCYVLSVGNRHHYKNFRTTAEGYVLSRLRAMKYHLLCVGPQLSDDESQMLSRLGIADRVTVMESVTDSELAWLYGRAHALVYPSEYEGFGLPPLEAMNCGCPVIVSNTSSLPEVVGEAAYMVNPKAPDQVGEGLDLLLDPEQRRKKVEAGFKQAAKFSWMRCAREHSDVYLALLGAHPASVGSVNK